MTTKDLSLNGVRSELLASLDDWLELDRRADDRPVVEVPVPEFGIVDGKPRTVLMRAMDQAGKDEWEFRYGGETLFAYNAEQAKERIERTPRKTVLEANRGVRSLLVSLCVVDQRGERIFTREHVDLLQRRNSAAVERLAVKAEELCGISQPNAQQAREALEQAKNSSGGAPAGEPPSA